VFGRGDCFQCGSRKNLKSESSNSANIILTCKRDCQAVHHIFTTSVMPIVATMGPHYGQSLGYFSRIWCYPGAGKILRVLRMTVVFLQYGTKSDLRPRRSIRSPSHDTPSRQRPPPEIFRGAGKSRGQRLLAPRGGTSLRHASALLQNRGAAAILTPHRRRIGICVKYSCCVRPADRPHPNAPSST